MPNVLSSDFQTIWRELLMSRRVEISAAFWDQAEPHKIYTVVRLLANRFHSREQTVARWPREKRVAHLADMPDLSRMPLQDIFRVFFFAHYKRMMAAFLDALGIPHEDCYFSTKGIQPPSETDLQTSIARLLQKFPRDLVELYMRVLYAQDSSFWAEVADLDFSKIEPESSSDSGQAFQDEEAREDGFPPLANADHEKSAPISGSELQATLGLMRDAFSKLTEKLKEASSILSAGLLPPTGFGAAHSDLQARIAVFSSNVRDRATAMGVIVPSEPNLSLVTLEGLITQIQSVEKSLENKEHIVDELITNLDSVLTLERADGREFPPLIACQDAARSSRLQLVQTRDPELDEESKGRMQAFKALLLMVRHGARIDEDESAMAYEAIAREFGTKLAVAVTRGLISIPNGTTAAPIPPVTIENGTLATATHPEQYAEPIQERGEVDPQSYQLDVERQGTDVPLAKTPDAEVPPLGETLPPPSNETSADKEDASCAESTAELGHDPSYRYLEGETSKLLASELLASAEPLPFNAVQRLVWLSLAEQKVSTAYQLSRCLERLYPELTLSISSTLIRAYALATEIVTPLGPIAAQLKTDFGEVVSAVHSGSTDQVCASHIMLVSSTIRPAINAPDTNASVVLEIGAQKLPRLNRLYGLCNRITDYTNVQLPLDPVALEYVDSSENWSLQFARLREEVEDWWAKAPGMPFKFAPAGKVWRKWLEPSGLVNSLICPIRNNDRGSINELKQLINRLSTDSKLRAELNFTDRHLRGRGVGVDINVALPVIQRHTRAAVDFASRWLSLQENQPSSQSDYRLNKLLEFRSTVDEVQQEIQEELLKGTKNAADLRVAAAICCCRRAVESLVSLLHPGPGNAKSEPEIKYILSSDLLLVPGLSLSPDWEPAFNDAQLLRALIESLASNSGDRWHDAFRKQSDEYRNHDATDRIIEFLRWAGGHDELVRTLSSEQQAHVRQCQNALLRQIDECHKKVENGVALGLVRDKERAEFLEVIERIREGIPSLRNFGKAETELAKINSAIERSRMMQVEQVRRRLELEQISSENPAFNRIISILDRGDVDTANEYIDLAVRGQNLPEPGDLKDVFGTFFPQAASEIDNFLSDFHQSGSLLSRIETQKGIPGVEMRDVPGAQVQEAIDLLEAWFALKKTKRPNKDTLRVLFERLAFEVLTVSEGSGHPRAWLAIQTRALGHRDQCPVPYFGSLANGNYRVLCIWDRPSEEEIVNQIRSGRQGGPIIVLYFGRLTEQKRRNLARLSRADHLSFLLIDEILVTYLCGESGVRMPVLFQCALPFTFVSPYTTTASLVPPEMFYGRRYERNRIIDPMGSCFVYGGRQLGKTALLLSIRNEFHSPSDGRIALWIDLKAAGATQDDIWLTLARAFRELPNVELNLGESRSEQRLIERLQAWLSRDERRRILLLLDEADRFLESDSKDGFKRTSILKGLMERTSRRFKVVFAGLHNVQRTTKQQNHPLAHFGEPICVGPLLDAGEWKEAKALIERPLWSMGFRFESPDLTTRILSQTNYYPSLIQLYCNQLFQFLTRESVAPFDWHTSPPYLITSKHVEDAYASRELRNAIRERFELTLNLDARYRVIALIIALYSQSNGERTADGVAVSDVRKHGVYFWERGFRDCRSEEDFRVLLEEMVGLGVLREVAGRFALRTPNILSLLGTQEEIESKLMSSSSEAPPPPFEAHVFRTSDQEQNWRRNPLTVLQDSELHADRNAVTILFGTGSAGLGDLNRFSLHSFGNTSCFTCGPELTDLDHFGKRLADLKEGRKSGTTLMLVQDCQWRDDWIDEAVDWCSKKTVSKFTNIVFVADPSATWRLAQNHRHIEELISQRLVSTLTLQPWHDSVLWQWLGDCGIGSNAADEQELISRGTGNWPHLLMEFRQRASGGTSWRTSLAEVCQRLTDADTQLEYLDAFGLSIEKPRRILEDMALLGEPVSVADLAGVLEAIPETIINQTVYWADRLSLIKPSPSGAWELDPIVTKLLTPGKPR